MFGSKVIGIKCVEKKFQGCQNDSGARGLAGAEVMD